MSGEEEHNYQRVRRSPPQLTAEELRTLQECNRESFWYRCVPLGVVMMGGTQILVNRGILKPNPRFGALFKNMAAGFAAYMIGKVSYQGECKKKILQLENSPLAEAIRGNRRGTEVLAEMASLSTTPTEQPVTERIAKKRSQEYDTMGSGSEERRVTFKDLDDNLRPTVDREKQRHGAPEISDKSQLTYEELRKQNRYEFDKRQPSNTRPDVSSARPSADSTRGSVSRKERVKRNEYGDIIEE